MRRAFAVLMVLAFGIGCADRAHKPPGQQDSGSTAEQEPPISRIAFGSCAFQWVEQPIFRTISAAEMIDYYVRLVGVDHVGIASDDMFTTKPTMDFVAKNAAMYADDGYMVNAFNRGASGCGEFAKILAAVTDELWEMGYSNEDLEKIYGRNKMRVYREVWEGIAPEDDPVDVDECSQIIDDLRMRFQSRKEGRLFQEGT